MLRVVMDEATYIMVVLQDMRKGGCICLQKGGGRIDSRMAYLWKFKGGFTEYKGTYFDTR